MKFLCDSCKAKYQIPDEKISGRTLRMKCRKCSHEIIIRGPKGPESGASESERRSPARTSASSAGRMPTSSSPSLSPSSSASRRRPSSATASRPSSVAASRPAQRQSSRPSALGADFRRGTFTPEPVTAKPPTEWYVAINDVPVGPIKREEVARKIGMGAVTGESLCWREGLDDWRPVSEVPELFALVKQRRVPAPPPVARGAKPAPPPAPPEERSNVIPIGGRLGAAAAPLLEEEEDEKTVMAPMPMQALGDPPDPPPVSPAVSPAVAAAAPIAATVPGLGDAFAPVPNLAEPAPPARRAFPPGLMIALVGAGAFGIAFAVILAQKMLSNDPEVAVVDEVEMGELDPIEAPVELDVPDEVPDEVEEAPDEDVPEETPEEASTGTTMGTSRPTSTMTATPAVTTTMRTAEEQALIDRFGGSANDPDLASVMVGGAADMSSSSRPALDGPALSRVINAPVNKNALQSCYTTAIRGNPEPPSVRVNVSITVGASGTVTRVSADGATLGNLRGCIEQRVRRWRFPASSDGGQAAFPLVFSPQ